MTRLERERRLRRLTCAGLGRMAGCDGSLIGRVERGQVDAYPALRHRLAEVLGVDEDELFADLDGARRAFEQALQGALR